MAAMTMMPITPKQAGGFRQALQERATPKSSKKTPGQGDRFIPNRSAMDMQRVRLAFLPAESGFEESDAACISSMDEDHDYKRQLAENLLGDMNRIGANSGAGSQSKILSFKTKAPAPPEGFENPNRVLYSQNSAASGVARSKSFRHVPQAAEKILDAPEIVDDYYLNLLDWNSANIVALALGGAVFLWDATSGSIEEMMRLDNEDEYVSSVSWAPDSKHLSVGLSSSEVQLWDTERLKQVRSLRGHSARVGSADWNGHILTTGGRDNLIINHDVRVRDHIQSRWTGHSQEICGLKWSPNGQQLASGANDNLLHIWDAAMTSSSSASSTEPWLHRMDDHRAAVKALAWCPFQTNLLASGGGTADRCIKFWNTHTGACVNSIDTNSQVCALQWSKHEKEILSSHGYSQNQLCLWKYPSMVKMAELTGHTARVLHMAQSPDGTMVASAAADETLRFWRVFGSSQDTASAATSRLAKAQSKEAGASLRIKSIR